MLNSLSHCEAAQCGTQLPAVVARGSASGAAAGGSGGIALCRHDYMGGQAMHQNLSYPHFHLARPFGFFFSGIAS
jgi:hypothetical protein